MRVLVYPADNWGCGHFRMIWPAEYLAELGHDVTAVPREGRRLSFVVRDDRVVDLEYDLQPDVVVFQRVTHKYLAQAIPLLRERGIAVVIDIDDDLSAIHPNNPAWEALHPRNDGRARDDGSVHMSSWHYLTQACRAATLVTVSTPALVPRYAPHGRAVVIVNTLPDHYYGVEHEDSDQIGWPASLHSHPDDPSALGNAISRLAGSGFTLQVFGDTSGVQQAFGLSDRQSVSGADPVDLLNWPRRISELGIGIAPLANTRFNAAKSWLKPLELSAVGVPWIGSPRDSYSALHRLGAGWLAEKPKDWYRKLRLLQTDPILRKELSEAGREVASSLRLRDHVSVWWDAWKQARETQDRC